MSNDELFTAVVSFDFLTFKSIQISQRKVHLVDYLPEM